MSNPPLAHGAAMNRGRSVRRRPQPSTVLPALWGTAEALLNLWRRLAAMSTGVLPQWSDSRPATCPLRGCGAPDYADSTRTARGVSRTVRPVFPGRVVRVWGPTRGLISAWSRKPRTKRPRKQGSKSDGERERRRAARSPRGRGPSSAWRVAVAGAGRCTGLEVPARRCGRASVAALSWPVREHRRRAGGELAKDGSRLRPGGTRRASHRAGVARAANGRP